MGGCYGVYSLLPLRNMPPLLHSRETVKTILDRGACGCLFRPASTGSDRNRAVGRPAMSAMLVLGVGLVRRRGRVFGEDQKSSHDF